MCVVCVCTLPASTPAKGAGSHRGLSNISSVNSDESYSLLGVRVHVGVKRVCQNSCSCLLEMIQKGPGTSRKQKHAAQTRHASFIWTEQLLPTRTVDSWMCASSFVCSGGLIGSPTVSFSSVFDGGAQMTRRRTSTEAGNRLDTKFETL